MTSLIPMAQTEFDAYIDNAIPAYAKEKVRSGQWGEAESLKLARASFDELLPQGLTTPDHYLFSIQSDDAVHLVGMIWIAAQTRADARIAYVYDVMVKPEYQRLGYATAAFQALEHEVRKLELSGIALHVFGHNKSAQALYQKLGFWATNINMFKKI
ncbi:GNAT family N-acetyltransferase [Undibacterium sp. Jales W-56]|uniref:GNAT family N-acetyltransferase n=1 Tax=Undibacterium sp. Jales W-56 TaxID=2897325 RepID=UPI0021D22D53|nr:GNAT family N-acetyltransferase [Undibacterium sp. Jales W-56]MCU6433586.1 GNAT family N-acetyltransferase [Undibacterium sp. Jales W-56]